MYKRDSEGRTLHLRRAAPPGTNHSWEFSFDGIRWLPALLVSHCSC